jgi:tRNA U34 5-carboxymethylaminomethyl modifying GTPase MnmE/TrmE
MEGAQSMKLESMGAQLLHCMAHVEASIDFVDEDDVEDTVGVCRIRWDSV